jgi:GNAT superfamily N-acetyltransferase
MKEEEMRVEHFEINGELFTIKVANRDNLNDVLLLLVNAAKWLSTKNTKQWDYYLSDLEGNTQEVLDSIDAEATYILLHQNRIMATITLENKPNEWDKEMWGEEANRENIVYLHRLVVHRDYAGDGIGAQLLKWAEEICKQSGKTAIRFDCLASNAGLNIYYENRYERKEIINKYGQHSKYEISL